MLKRSQLGARKDAAWRGKMWSPKKCGKIKTRRVPESKLWMAGFAVHSAWKGFWSAIFSL